MSIRPGRRAIYRFAIGLATLAVGLMIQAQPAPPSLQPGQSTGSGGKPTAQRQREGVSPEEFEAFLRERLPLSTEQTRAVRESGAEVNRASKQRLGAVPKPVSTVVRVKLAPGASHLILRLTPDITSAVVFADVTGAPWNVQRIVVGRKAAIDIPEAKDGKEGGDLKVATNKFTVVPMDDHVSTSMMVYLEGAPAPIPFIVATAQPEVDLRMDVTVEARGPNAVMPTLSRNLTESVPAELTSMLSGITPNAAKPLRVTASDVADVKAWVIGTRMYVRARATVIAPPVPKDGKVVTGTDGTKVFELPFAPEVLLMQGGSVGRLRLAGFPLAANAPTQLNQR